MDNTEKFQEKFIELISHDDKIIDSARIITGPVKNNNRSGRRRFRSAQHKLKNSKSKKRKLKIRTSAIKSSVPAVAKVPAETQPNTNKIQFSGTRILNDNFNTGKSVILNEGGARSSKSYSIAQLFIYRFFTERNKKFLVCRKSLKSLKYSVFRTFIEILTKHELLGMVKINKTMLEFTFESNYMLMTSIDDPAKIQSTEFNYIWMEEAEEFIFNDYMVLKTRLSASQEPGKINQIFLSYNPRKRAGYINKAVKLEDDVEIIKSSYKDNQHIQDTYSKLLESIKKSSPEFYNAYTLGEYTSDDEQVFPNIKIIDKIPEFKCEVYYFGLDFGFHNHTAFLLVQEEHINNRKLVNGIYRDNITKKYYVTELIYEKLLTNADLIEKLLTYKIEYGYRIYCDPAEPGRLEEIKRTGLTAIEAKKDVAAGLDYIRSREIYSLRSNTNFNHELENYCYAKDSHGELTDFPEKKNDHLMDALRYAMFSESFHVTPNVRFF
ncbi:PBSX family phage terminase large subunit [soil metagenome]